MAWDTIGFTDSLVRQDTQAQDINPLNPVQFEQPSIDFSAQKITGILQSRDGKMKIDLDKGLISIKDSNGQDKVQLGRLDTNQQGIKIKGQNTVLLETNEENDTINLPSSVASFGNLTNPTFRRITNPFKKYVFIPGTQFDFIIPTDLTVLFLIQFFYGRNDFPGQNTYDLDVALDIDGKIYLGNIDNVGFYSNSPSGISDFYFLNATVNTTIQFFPAITQHTILSLSKGNHRARMLITNNGDTGLDIDILSTSLSYLAL